MRTVVLDTNVLLADPGVLFAFPDAEVVIPETVLGELDKLKTSRADPDLRFRGREVSRMLFDLSEQGSLIEGVDLPDGGRLRVVPLEGDFEMPGGLSTRNADDKILAVAYQVCHSECERLTMVTNDLNMLLKAQALGLEVERYGDGVEGSFARRYIVRPFQRYKIPLGILGMSLGVFAAIVFVLMVVQPRSSANEINVPTELRETFSATQLQALTLLQDLEKDPNNADTLLKIANTYYELTNYARATQYYERYLKVEPGDLDAQTDLSAAYFYSGKTDLAIQTVNGVLAKDPEHVKAIFNLGIMYWQGRRDTAAAIKQFERVLEITKNAKDAETTAIRQAAENNIAAIQKEAGSSSPTSTGGA